jgi:hypothetical protein
VNNLQTFHEIAQNMAHPGREHRRMLNTHNRRLLAAENSEYLMKVPLKSDLYVALENGLIISHSEL